MTLPTVTHEMAKELDQLGFNYHCHVWYTPDGLQTEHPYMDKLHKETQEALIRCPSLALVQQWLREEHEIYLSYRNYSDSNINVKIWYECYIERYVDNSLKMSMCRVSTHKEALLKGIEESLKLIK